MSNYAGNQDYIRAMEKDRLEALASQDALNYAVLCDELGVSPEDEHLYERGYLEASLLDKEEEPMLKAIEGSPKLEMYRALRNVSRAISEKIANGKTPNSLFIKL